MTHSMDNIFVTYVNVDHDFIKIWGQQDRTCATYVEKQLLQLVPEFSASSGPNPTSVCKGMFCFAKYADDNYYRAKIISDVQCNSVIVSFVDYGNRDYVDLSNIRIQSGAVGGVLSKIIPQAEEFYLARVKASGGSWTKDVLDQIRRDLCYEEFNYRLISHLGSERLIQINFHNEDYANLLIRRNLATEISIENQQSLILKIVTQNIKHPQSRTEDINKSMPLSDFGNINYKHQIAQNEQMNRNENTTSGKIYRTGPKLHNYIKPSHSASMSSAAGPNMNNFVNNQRQTNYHNVQNVNSLQSGPLYNQNDLGNDSKTETVLNSVNTDVIEAIANQLKQHLLKDSFISTMESVPHNYTTRVLEVGTTHNVYVSYIDDGPWSFSVQLVSDEHELNQLMDDLAGYDLTPIKLPVVLGYPCVAKSKEYGNFCRGVVVNVSLGAVKVYFVDFGNAEDLPVTSLYELPTKFFKTKVLSQKFALNGLQHIKISDKIKKAFIEVVENELLLLQVTTLEGDTLPTCELYIKDRNIKRILHEKVKQVWRWDPVEIPKPGTTELALVTWIESPKKFFVQLNKNAADIKALRMELAKKDAKGEMFAADEIKPETSCICCFTDDNEWYRAIVTKVNSKNTATVFYVDFGNTDTVNFSMIRKIGNSQLIREMKTQAIQCCLKGYESRLCNDAVTQVLETYVLEKEVRMTVISAEKYRIVVRLRDENTEITLPLIENKLFPQASLKFQDVHEECKQNSENRDSLSIKNKEENKTNLLRNSCPYEDMSDNSKRREKIIGRKWRNEMANSNSTESCSRVPRRELNAKRKDSTTDRSGTNKPVKYGFGSADRKRDSTSSSDRSKNGRNIEKNWRTSSSDEKNRSMPRDEVKGRRNDKKFKTEATSNIRMRLKKIADEVRMNNINHSEMFQKTFEQVHTGLHGSTFKSKDVKIGSTEDVIVTYYVNPGEIYIQVLSEKEEFRRMMDDIQNYYATKLPLQNCVKKGNMVIAKFKEDEILYRAVVVDTSPLRVRYADYGNEEIISKLRLWPMNKKFLELEIQAIKCSISGIKPKDGDKWPVPNPETDKIFECEKYSCTFIGYKDGLYEVDLKVSGSEIAVKDELIRSGYALPIKTTESLETDAKMDMTLMCNEIIRVYISHIIDGRKFFIQITLDMVEIIERAIANYTESQQMLDVNFLNVGMLCLAKAGDRWFRARIIQKTKIGISVYFIDYGDQLDLAYEQIKYIPQDLANYQPQAVECCFLSESDVLPKDVNDKFINCINKHFLAFIHEVVDDRLKVTLYNFYGSKLEYLEYLNDAPSLIQPIGSLPIISQEMSVFCSHVASPEEIYVQGIDNEILDKFNSKMRQFYSKNYDSFQVKDIAETGKLCAAKWDADNSWYRARILSVGENVVEVFFLDYGNSEKLSLENIRELDSSFYEQHAFAKRVSLEIDYEKDNITYINEKIHEFVGEKKCIGHFWKERGVLFAELVVNDIDVTEWLISKCGMKLNLDTIINEPIEEPRNKDSSGISVFISHAVSPSEFWIHEESVSNELLSFQNALQKSCSNRLAKKDVNIGDVVGASFSDDLWYRAEVTDIVGNVLTVRFIDYGNFMEVDLSRKEVMELNEELDVPPFATYCSLTGSWKENAVYRFEEIITEHQDPFTLIELESGYPKIVDLLQNGNSVTKQLLKEGFGGSDEIYEVDSESEIVFISHVNSPSDFYLQRACDKLTLGNIISEVCNANTFEKVLDIKTNEIYGAKCSIDDHWYRAKIIKRDTNGEYEMRSVDYGNHIKTSTLKLLPLNLRNIPEMAFNCCLVYGRSNDNWSEAACDKFREYLNVERLIMKLVLRGPQKSIVQLYKTTGESISEELETLCERDARTEVYVTHVNSPDDFYVRNVNDQHFDLISECLKFCDNLEELNEMKVGIYCASKYEGSSWHRAEIRKICCDGECEVFFIDSGNTSTSRELKKLPKEIEEIKPLAKNCSLNFPATSISESIKEEFVNLTDCSDKVFRVLVIKPGDRDIVSLMLDGKKLEEVLLYTLSENSEVYNIYLEGENQNFMNSGINESQDTINCSIQNYDHSNIEDDSTTRNSFKSENDVEEKVDNAINTAGIADGFKSDDEKIILDNGSASTNAVNVPDVQCRETYVPSVEYSTSEEPTSTSDSMVDATVSQSEF